MLFELKLLVREFMEYQNNIEWLKDNEDRYFRVIEIVIMEFQHNPKFTVPVLKFLNTEYPLRKLWIQILRRWRIFGVHSIHVNKIRDAICPKLGNIHQKLIGDTDKDVVDTGTIILIFRKTWKKHSSIQSMIDARKMKRCTAIRR